MDTGTYVQSYRVGTGPLWIWGLIATACAGVLMLAFLALLRSPHRPARWLLVVSLLGALLNGVLAWRTWDAWVRPRHLAGAAGSRLAGVSASMQRWRTPSPS